MSHFARSIHTDLCGWLHTLQTSLVMIQLNYMTVTFAGVGAKTTRNWNMWGQTDYAQFNLLPCKLIFIACVHAISNKTLCCFAVNATDINKIVSNWQLPSNAVCSNSSRFVSKMIYIKNFKFRNNYFDNYLINFIYIFEIIMSIFKILNVLSLISIICYVNEQEVQGKKRSVLPLMFYHNGGKFTVTPLLYGEELLYLLLLGSSWFSEILFTLKSGRNHTYIYIISKIRASAYVYHE